MADNKITRDELENALAQLTKREYSLSDMWAGKPGEDLFTTNEFQKMYNKQQVPDKQYHKYVPLESGGYGINKLMQGWDMLAGSNAQDTFRYFHPETKFRSADAAEADYGTLGFVNLTRAPKTVAMINDKEVYHKINPLDILTHEASHVETAQRKDNKRDIFGEVPGIDYRALVAKLPPKVKEKYLPAANAELDFEELRANLRAGLGKQPKGTTEQEYFADLLKHAPEMGVKYYPTEATGHGDVKNLQGQAQILRGLMNDLFPRERWIEPRQPTMKEKIQDYINKLLAK